MSEFKRYRKTAITEMRPYEKGESLEGVAVSPIDLPPEEGGMIARDPNNHKDMWFVARAYFIENYEEVA